MRFLTTFRLAAVLCAALMTALFSATAQATPGCRISEHAVTTSSQGTFSLGPSRLDEQVVTPGEKITIQGMLANRDDEPITLRIDTSDLAASPNPQEFVRRVQNAEFGAGSWIEPSISLVSLEPGQLCSFNIDVVAPATASVGSNYAALIATAVTDTSSDAAGHVGGIGQALSQLFFRIDGDLVRKGEVVNAKISRKVLFSGSGFVTYGFEYANKGNVSDTLKGKVVIRSMFGNVVAELPFREIATLRGSHRRLEELWPNPPRFGRFTAEVVLESDAGKYRKDFPAIVILPPKWLDILFLLAVLLPIAVMLRRRRNSWKQYLDDDESNDWEPGIG